MLLLISDKAEQWKRNKVTELEEKGWTETFTEFTKKFKDYWEVVGREGLALTEIYKMHKDKLKIPLYIASFKERIKEMGIKDDIAIIPMFSQGLKLLWYGFLHYA